VEEEAEACGGAAADAAAELVELGEAEALGVLDDDHIRFGDIDADFDHGGGDEDFGNTGLKAFQGAVARRRIHLAVGEGDDVAEFFAQRGVAMNGGSGVKKLGFGDERADPVDPAAAGDGAGDGGKNFFEVGEFVHGGGDGLSTRRFFGESGNVHFAPMGEQQGARDGGGGHHQKVGFGALGGEGQALIDAEAVLFVDDGQSEVLEFDVFLEDGVGADQQGDGAVGEAFENISPRFAFDVAGEEGDGDRGVFLDGGKMLLCQNFRGRQKRRLGAGLDGAQHGEEGQNGLAGADVALQEAEHLLRGGEVGVDFAQRLKLAGGE